MKEELTEEIIWIRKKNEVYLQVDASPGILREMQDHFKFRVPGYQFHPAYKRRQWDGFLRIFNTYDGTLFLGLINRLEEFCKTRNYKVIIEKEVTDRVLAFTQEDAKNYSLTLKLPFELREDQLKIIHHCIVNNRALILSPTSSGKSALIYSLARWYHEKTLIIVPTLDLISQTYDMFKTYSKDNKFDVEKNMHTIFSGQDKDSKKQIFLSTWQSIHKMSKKWFDQFNLVIFDEAHTAQANCIKDIMIKLENCKYRFGLTGTLDGSKCHEMVLSGLFGEIFSGSTSSELMKKKVISDLQINCLILEYSEAERKQVKELKYHEEIKFLTLHSKRNKFIKNLAISMKNNTLVLFQYIEHGKTLFELIKEELKKTDPKRRVFFIAGEIEKDVREKVRLLTEKEKNAIIVASVAIYSTGINIRNLKTLIFASPTKSRIRTLQSIGRTLRIGDESSEAIMYDIVDDLTYKSHQNFATTHFLARAKIYKSEKYPFKIKKIILTKDK